MPYKDKAQQTAAQAAWYQKNKERVKAQKRQWKRDNKERVAELQRKYAATEAHKIRRRAYEKSKRDATRAYNKIKNAKWRKENRETYLQSKARLYYKRTYGEYAEAHRLITELKELSYGEETSVNWNSIEEQALGNATRRAKQDRHNRRGKQHRSAITGNHSHCRLRVKGL